jgi:SAM-dependent methyltransferase
MKLYVDHNNYQRQPVVEPTVVKGFVQTPNTVVDFMVNKLFSDCPPRRDSTLLDPGCGTGNFIAGVIKWCEARGVSLPAITGVELDSSRAALARAQFACYPSVRIEHRDFLASHLPAFDYVVGNPPYVPITEMMLDEKQRYRSMYLTASGRFDLYLLFFEQALRCLKPGGKLVLITPEKFVYVATAGPLRRLLASKQLKELLLLPEDLFGNLVTYPTISVLVNQPGPMDTKVVLRNGRSIQVVLSDDGSSWLPSINGTTASSDKHSLVDICRRVSCGIATGADSVFVKRQANLDTELRPFAYPTISGRELTPSTENLNPTSCMLVPYTKSGKLIEIAKLGAFGRYLSQSDIHQRLERRTCVVRKPWHAFHETPLLDEILRPKILCKDIAPEPRFWIDRTGSIVPRHSVYYIVPEDPSVIDDLAGYLNSSGVKEWLRAHCQHASKGFLRIQSSILKKLPLPQRMVSDSKKNEGFEDLSVHARPLTLLAPK